MPDRKPVSGLSPEAEKNEANERRNRYVSHLRDPYSLTTRKARRNLLVSSVLALSIAWADATPNSIPALGLIFSDADQAKLLVVLLLIVLFFLLSFFIYAVTEHAAFKIQTDDDDRHPPQSALGDIRRFFQDFGSPWHLDRIWDMRRYVEFTIPVLIGLGVVIALIVEAISMNAGPATGT